MQDTTTKTTIYLWVSGEGWKPFILEDSAEELKSRKIEIGNAATIGYAAKIGDEATIGDEAKIGYAAKIGKAAKIGNAAKIVDEAKIGDEAVVKTLFISCYPYPLSYWGENCIQIGCTKRTIEQWLDSVEFGKDHDYTDTQIEEYRSHVLLIKSFHELNAFVCKQPSPNTL